MPSARRTRTSALRTPRVGRPRAATARATPRTNADRTLLAVDIGNSNIVLGEFKGDALEGVWRLTSVRRTDDEIALALRDVLRARRPEAAVVCSVVPALTATWMRALGRWLGAVPLEVSATTAGIEIRTRDRNAVGADRLANAIAARALYGTPAIVVDLGTATNFDCVSKSGSFLGGAIAPGVGAASEALLARAARLSRFDLARPERAIGRTTVEALQAGVVWGAAGLVDALVRRLALEMKGTPNVIATGGFAAVVAPECETINRVDDALTLKGMRLIWEANR